MKKITAFLVLVLWTGLIAAHYSNITPFKLREWRMSDNTIIHGSFLMMKNNAVYIEKNDGGVVHFPLSAFGKADQSYAAERYAGIQMKNIRTPYGVHQAGSFSRIKLLTVLFLLILISLFFYFYSGVRRLQYIAYFMLVGLIGVLYGFKKASYHRLSSITSPGFVDSAFLPFKPDVITSWDNNYFYVGSKGVPTTHEMMVGISDQGWQQQVPIPQCYLLPNAWPIPLNPVMSAAPIPVDSIHFTRGAIAIAANGVPIFNVHTNTGVDSYLDGQLDNFGGHCGRADDYHYHIAPLHLYNYTSTSLPCAFGLDGFAVYGDVEPDGAAMLPLDANHGHYGSDGIYHYHGTASAPYMIARMAGTVTEDNTHQLIPQAAAHPVRPSRTPLKGALITSCVNNANNNGYVLTYTKFGQIYQIDYSWDTNGNYTFRYIGSNGTLDSVYHGFTQCELPTGISEITESKRILNVFPNPARDQITLSLSKDVRISDVKSVSIYNSAGRSVYADSGFRETVRIDEYAPGIYFVEVKISGTSLVKKLVIH